MKTQTPSSVSARNGFVAGGKKVQVKYDETNHVALDTVLGSLEFMMKNRQPRDRIVVECRSAPTEKGLLSICMVSLTGDSDNF